MQGRQSDVWISPPFQWDFFFRSSHALLFPEGEGGVCNLDFFLSTLYSPTGLLI